MDQILYNSPPFRCHRENNTLNLFTSAECICGTWAAVSQKKKNNFPNGKLIYSACDVEMRFEFHQNNI